MLPGHRYERQERPEEDGYPDGEEDGDVRDALLPDAEELRLLARRRGLRLDGEGLDVVDGEHGGRHEPRQAEDGADHDEHGHDQQVQVVPSSLLQLVLLPERNYFTITILFFRSIYVNTVLLIIFFIYTRTTSWSISRKIG